MKKGNLIQWVVAVCLVLVTAYTAVHVHHANQKNAIKMAKQAKLDKQAAKREKQLLKKIKRHERKPLSYELSSLTMPYPNVGAKQYHNTKKHPYRLWVEVSLAKQRVYIKSGRYTLYTMNASAAKNYDKGQKEYQKTPLGLFKLDKNRGQAYFDATRGYGAKSWVSFTDGGLHRFESVPVNKDGQVIKASAKQLGQKVTRKHNVKAYGSIRLSLADAQWFAENMPAKTPIFIHQDPKNHFPDDYEE